jgi:IMP dehydrogenase
MFPANSVMTKEVITTTKDTSIYEAVKSMVNNRISGLPVIDENRLLVGILTEKDALMLLQNADSQGVVVGDFMTSEVIKFNEEDSLIKVSNCLIKNPYRRVPIVNTDNQLVGIVSRRDIMKKILEMRHINLHDSGLQGEDA